MKLREITACLTLPANSAGRDLIVGDLHGHRALFELELERIAFDPSRDRVLSVGDLIDRGPDSLETLALIDEPWFHAVLGNHELMLLNYLGYYSSRVHSRKSYASGCSGAWVGRAISTYRKAFMRLVERAAALPLAIHVQDDVPCNVMHGDLHPLVSRQHHLFESRRIPIHEADASATSRHNIATASGLDMLELAFGRHVVDFSPTPLSTLPVTYVGHSPLPRITVHNSYVYIDQGVCAGSTKRGAAKPPTVLEHRKFVLWLGGVATARAAMSDCQVAG